MTKDIKPILKPKSSTLDEKSVKFEGVSFGKLTLYTSQQLNLFEDSIKQIHAVVA